jgi:hypothetical protein
MVIIESFKPEALTYLTDAHGPIQEEDMEVWDRLGPWTPGNRMSAFAGPNSAYRHCLPACFGGRDLRRVIDRERTPFLDGLDPLLRVQVSGSRWRSRRRPPRE